MLNSKRLSRGKPVKAPAATVKKRTARKGYVSGPMDRDEKNARQGAMAPGVSRPVRALSDAEEARIQAGIKRDPDNPEVTEAQFARMRPAAEVLPPGLYAALTRPRGRPKAEETKVPVKLRVDRATVAVFKAGGDGWQTRMNAALAAAAKRIAAKQQATRLEVSKIETRATPQATK